MSESEDWTDLESKTIHFWKNKYFEYQDTQNDCAHTCLSIITSLFGKKIPKNWFRKNFPPHFGGISILELKKMASKIGIETEAFQCDWQTLESLRTPLVLYFENHFIILSRKKNGKLVLANPAIGISDYRSDSEPKDWTGICLALHPSEEFNKPLNPPVGLQLNFSPFLPLIGFPILLILFSFLPALLYLGEGQMFHKVTFELFRDKNLSDDAGILLIAIIFLEAAKDLTSLFSLKLLVNATEKFDIKLGFVFFKRLLQQGFEQFQSIKFGDIDLIFDELVTLRKFLIGSPLKLLSSFFMTIVLGYFSWNVSPGLLYIPILTTGLSILLLLPLRNQILSRNQVEFITREKFTTMSRNYFSVLDLISRFRLKRTIISSLSASFDNNLESNTGVKKSETILQVINGSVVVISEMAIMITLLKDHTAGKMSAPDMIFGYWLSTGILGSLTSIVTLLINYARLRLTYSRLGLVITPESSTEDNQRPPLTPGNIFPLVLDDVSFSYIHDNELLALNNVSMAFDTPGIYGIFGKSGSGKSTLGLILAGLYTPSSGKITSDGRLSTGSDRLTQTAYVFQDEGMFNRSVIENIILHDMSAPNEEFIKAIKTTTIDSILKERPDIEVSELSEGQRQRISLARALYRNRKMVILDEGTHSLDFLAEKAFLESFRKQYEESILVIISHRSSTMKLCDKVFIMENGKLSRQGPLLQFGTEDSGL